MWLQLRRVLKKFTEGNARKFTVSFAFCAHVDVIKIEKHCILVPRAYDPSGLRQESRALGATILKQQRK